MAKKGGRKAGPKRAAKRLETARERLQAAEARSIDAEIEGRRLIDRARQRAERLAERAATRVSKRRDAVRRAEEFVASLAASPAEPVPVPEPEPAPEADLAVGGESRAILGERETRALRALQGLESEYGASAQEWRIAAGMPPTTFRRARDGLLQAGLVTQNGDSTRESRYLLTEAGASVQL